jgi:hypothetical protein
VSPRFHQSSIPEAADILYCSSRTWRSIVSQAITVKNERMAWGIIAGVGTDTENRDMEKSRMRYIGR